MNKLLNFFNKFEVSPFATIFILLTLLTNSYKLFYIYFMITFIHELGHIIAASLLKLKIGKIKLLAIGFNAEIDDLDYTSSLKEFLIAIAGPLTYFVSAYLLQYLYQIDFISYNALKQAQTINKYNLVFNLLPIIPLDGGRILKIIIDNFFTSKKTLYIVAVLSCFFTLIFIYITIGAPQWLVYVFLVLTNTFFFLSINKRWKLILINRLNIENRYRMKIHNEKDIYRNKNNLFIINKTLVGEKEGIMYLIKNNVLKN